MTSNHDTKHGADETPFGAEPLHTSSLERRLAQNEDPEVFEPCPSEDELLAFALGYVATDSESFADVRGHVEHCADCAAKVAGICADRQTWESPEGQSRFRSIEARLPWPKATLLDLSLEPLRAWIRSQSEPLAVAARSIVDGRTADGAVSWTLRDSLDGRLYVEFSSSDLRDEGRRFLIATSHETVLVTLGLRAGDRVYGRATISRDPEVRIKPAGPGH
ncbi:MAG TPA: hypothetical protein VJN18_11465 [Polyangiaceae bacterium]|nr:hypothetical protein [Polyangiaceae bacterium]